MYSDGVGMGTGVVGTRTDGTGMGTGVIGMGWGWGETYGDGGGMGRTSCLLSPCSSLV